MINSFKKIMLIDDDKAVQEIMQLGFSRYNETLHKDHPIQFIQKNNGKEGVEYLVANHDRVGLILLDVEMPVMDGWQTLEVIKNSPMLEGIPVIIFSSHSGQDFEDKVKSFGAIGYIQKPSCMSQLSHIIKRIDKMRRLGRVQRLTQSKAALEECVSSYAGAILAKLEDSVSCSPAGCRRSTDPKPATGH